MIFKQLLWSLPFLLMLNGAFGQVKYEKEYRIDQEGIPDSALLFIQDLNFSKQIKWYKEESLEEHSIEAKTKSRENRRKYSIEFSKNGTLEDVEVEINWKVMPVEVQRGICSYLGATFDKYKIQKVQVQFTGAKAAMKEKVRARTVQPGAGINTHYELIAKVKKEGEYQRLELLFNQEGELVQESILVSKNTDNLEY